jgi:hypothetical protein
VACLSGEKVGFVAWLCGERNFVSLSSVIRLLAFGFAFASFSASVLASLFVFDLPLAQLLLGVGSRETRCKRDARALLSLSLYAMCHA